MKVPLPPLARMSALFLAAVGVARADTHGLVVRLNAGGEAVDGKVTVTLTPTTGTATVMTLADDGKPPDVSAGDGTWSGSSWLDGDDFTVSLTIGDKTLDGGKAAWAATDTARDLTISLSGGNVAVEAGVGAGMPPPVNGDAAGANSGAAPGGSPSSPLAPGTTPGASAGSGPTPGTPVPGGPAPGGPVGATPNGGATGTDSLTYIGFGVGLLVLVAVAWLWLRSRPADASARPNGVVQLPEPGLLGDGTPSLSDGLSVWIADAEDAEALVRPLAATLARHHRVLFVAPAATNPPAVFGGPVFRAANVRPSHVGDAAEALLQEGGAPVAVLVVGAEPTVALHKDYADLLPVGTGGISIVRADPGAAPMDRVTAKREGNAWVLQTKARTLRVVEGPNGFVEESAR